MAGMNHKTYREYEIPQRDMSERSAITYLICEEAGMQKGIGVSPEHKQWEQSFRPSAGKLVVSLWVRFDIHNTGVNVLSLFGDGEDGTLKRMLRIDTEGAWLYAYDGWQKKKLCHFNSDDYYSIYVAIDVERSTYSLYIDGVKWLSSASFFHPVSEVSRVSMESVGGTMYVKQLHVYPRPVQSVEQAAAGRRIYCAREYGVCADGKTVVTKELQQLIDMCGTHERGGVVYLEGGTFLTGMLECRSNVTLYIEEDAVLKGVLDIDAYPVRVSKQHPNWNTLAQGPQKALIYADTQENIAIMGGGTIDGSGDFPGEYGSESLRVSAVLLVGCPDVLLCDLHVKDAGMWTIPVVECDNLYIHDVNIDSTWYPNRDGIDICDCYDVLVENCSIQSDDDAVCLKSGNESGCDNILVRNTFIISTMANGIKFGTYSYGGFTNCVCEDCIIKDTRTCAIAVQCVDGGQIRGLCFRRIEISNVESVFFVIIADKGRTPEWGSHRIGIVEELVFEDIYAEKVRRGYGSYLGGYASGSERYPIRNIRFERVRADYLGGVSEVPQEPPEFENQYPESNCFGNLPASGYYIRHAENIVFEDCETNVLYPDSRQVFYLSDTEDVVVNGKVFPA